MNFNIFMIYKRDVYYDYLVSGYVIVLYCKFGILIYFYMFYMKKLEVKKNNILKVNVMCMECNVGYNYVI